MQKKKQCVKVGSWIAMTKVKEEDAERGHYRVSGNLWKVGSRYKVLHELGSGSYGNVCKALDKETGQYVSIKRLEKVTKDKQCLKLVLRELSILSRLSHPFIIFVNDAFIDESEKDGGINLYIVTEFANMGTLHDLPDKLSGHQVKLLLWQLLKAVEYMHSCHVWHRDIKPANVLLVSPLDVKICNFNVAQSADEASTGSDYGLVSASKSTGTNKDLQRHYPKRVVTATYCAPEVIMSLGQYTSTIDLWSVGCIFWELLIRSVHSVGSAAVQEPIRPLFHMRHDLKAPKQGENFKNDNDLRRVQELTSIFNVIGTPCWSDIECIPCESWRGYLNHLPGKSGNLFQRLPGNVEDGALDLLSRMLVFDPSNRCTATEALAHDYFKGLQPKETPATQPVICMEAYNRLLELSQLEEELEHDQLDHEGLNKFLRLLIEEIKYRHWNIVLQHIATVPEREPLTDEMLQVPSTKASGKSKQEHAKQKEIKGLKNAGINARADKRQREPEVAIQSSKRKKAVQRVNEPKIKMNKTKQK